MKALEVIKIGSNLLKEKKIPAYILDSEILLSKTLNISREEMLGSLQAQFQTIQESQRQLSGALAEIGQTLASLK